MAPLSTDERGPTIASITTTTTNNTTQTDAITTTTTAIRPARRYRGSFSTSICALFTNPQRRTDCCALACCGLLSSDRTRYLILGERPPPWYKRTLLNLGLPVLILILLATAQYYVPQDDGDEDDDEDESNNNETLRIVENILVLTFWICIACLIARGQRKRMEVREEMIRRLYRLDHPEEFHNDEDDTLDYDDLDGTVRLELYQRMQYHDTVQAHRLCCGCYANDLVIDGGEDGLEEMEHERRIADLCSCLWNWLSKLCCGWVCGLWCLCCGMCALGQEEREVDLGTLGVGKKERMVDYVTFEPYSNYYPAIESIRSNEIQSFIAHCRALSQLSIKLLRGIAVIIIFLALFALTDIDSNFTVRNMLVLLATFFQSFLVLHFVHWRYNKFDLSFDAVIKYFASGFILSTALAYIYELLVGTVFSIGVWFIFVVGTINKFNVEDGEEEPDPKEVAKQFAKDNVWLVIIYVFLNAFVVAALIEELCKYYGYWMVEHPDFMSKDELREGGIIPQEMMTRETTDTNDGSAAADDVDALHSSSSSDRTTAAESGTDHPSPSAPPKNNNDRTLQSTGAAITVGMVSTALGFACCENLLYVFMYSPKSIKIEVYTLALRSMFPIHPLCAAIQSIGVCRRDLEGDTNLKLGRIIFVPLLIHGGFDFVIMLIETLDALKHMDDDKENKNEDSIAETVETIELESELPSIIVGLVFVIIGILYYAIRANAQRKRLMAVDSDKRSVLGDSLVVC